jgi:hypothetical protein
VKKKILVIFPTEWVAYSPTILNLIDALRSDFSLKVIAIDNNKYDNTYLDKAFFEIIRIPPLLFKLLAALGLYRIFKFYLLKHKLKGKQSDIVIGVDSIGFYTAQKLFGEAHFLSLELEKNYFFKKINPKSIISITIQTEERLKFLFPDYQGKIFYIPNSPILRPISVKKRNCEQFSTIFFGNAHPNHGTFTCIEAISELEDVSITIKGIIANSVRAFVKKRYAHLLEKRRIVLDDTYISQDAVLDYLVQFDAGFCLYDLDLINKGDFNYISCPSGKVFNYFGAGVPVIGLDTLGLKCVKIYNAGILVNVSSKTEIINAIKTIRSNYIEFRNNCFKAAKAFDFMDNSKMYKTFLLETSMNSQA